MQRDGFHGLPLESVVRQPGADVPEQFLIARLRSDASVTALKAGRSFATGMGLTRSGDVILAARGGGLGASRCAVLALPSQGAEQAACHAWWAFA